MSIDYKDIGQRIKRLRMEKGLTQERLSEIIGIGPSHMSHIESGSTVPSLEVFISIALSGNQRRKTFAEQLAVRDHC